MHTLAKRRPEKSDFEEGTDDYLIYAFCGVWEQSKGDVTRLKMNLPEGFLQRRVICTNYKTLRNILWQREGHRLHQWETFCSAILSQVAHPELIKEQN